MDVTVALVGDPDSQESYDPDSHDVGVGTPYGELPAVTLDVELDDTLRDVLGRAARQFGITGPGGSEFEPDWVSFYKPSHEEAYTLDGEALALTLVDPEGRALWGVHVGDPRITMAALRRAEAAGLVDGDPSRPYLLIRPTIGNGLIPDWHELVVGFWFLREALGIIADGAGVAPIATWTRERVRKFWERVRRIPDILQDKSDDWTSRGASPYAIDQLIGTRLWKSEDLAPLLDISADDVDALLAGRGMVKDARTGYWHLGEDYDSRTVHEIYEFAMRHEWSSINEAGETETVRTEIRRIVTRGMEPETDDL